MKYTYCFDLDLTLCQTYETDYVNAKPIENRIACVNSLYDDGNFIKIHTARGSESKIDFRNLTVNQLNHWGLKFHELHFGKPAADYYVDDKAVNCDDFNWG